MLTFYLLQITTHTHTHTTESPLPYLHTEREYLSYTHHPTTINVDSIMTCMDSVSVIYNVPMTSGKFLMKDVSHVVQPTTCSTHGVNDSCAHFSCYSDITYQDLLTFPYRKQLGGGLGTRLLPYNII